MKAMTIEMKAMSISMRAMSISMRAMSIEMKAMSIEMRAMSIEMKAMTIEMKAMSIEMKAMTIEMKAMSIEMKAMSIEMKAMSVEMAHVCPGKLWTGEETVAGGLGVDRRGSASARALLPEASSERGVHNVVPADPRKRWLSSRGGRGSASAAPAEGAALTGAPWGARGCRPRSVGSVTRSVAVA